ncbi:MAG: NAD(P)-dependent oxidoreductase [Bacteroidetes bacterium HGW-Bacteroidetes-4]|jgi:nucleoside-diphosphate-sugar epimerase|nr:MAG: NAD(P)-dependent oxidoreductase [Bacteroidetes bacterium HGW-Bacteroidetes-4]
MQKKLSILGCGWLGLPLGQSLVEKGWELKGSVTSPSKQDALRETGIEPFVLDLKQKDYETATFLDSEFLLMALPPQEAEDYQRFIGKLEKSGLKKVLFISSTSVYAESNDELNEEAPLNDGRVARAEALFTNNPNFKCTVLRFGGLFGYNRKPGNFFPEGRIIPNPEGVVNLIHRDDCIGIINALLEQEAWCETFNACAPSHPTRRAFYTREQLKQGRVAPVFSNANPGTGKRINCQKLIQRIAYSFIHPDLMTYSE